MRKSVLILMTLCINYFLVAQTYPDYSTNWHYSEFLVNEFANGGGSVTFQVNNDILTVSFNAGFEQSPLSLGLILETGTNLPDMFLGIINSTDYKVSIINNYIFISSATHSPITNFSNSIFVIDLNDPDSWPEEETEFEGYVMPYVSDDQNYVYKVEPLEPINNFNDGMLINAIHSVDYIDEIGRLKQNIAIGQSPNNKDQILHVEYDDFGRKTKDYLRYASDSQGNGEYVESVDAILQTTNFYQSNYNDSNVFSEKAVEHSLLNRVIKQGSVGMDWQVNPNSDSDKVIKMAYNLNVESENIKKFRVIHDGNKIENTTLVFEGYYNDNTLFKTIIKDENWRPDQEFSKNHTTEEFQDGLGRVILKRTYNSNDEDPFETYYVHDDFGNLTYIIPPKASDEIIIEGEQGFRVSAQTNYPWTYLVNVDKEFAEEYDKKLSEYKNEDILNIDLDNKFNGQGGFTITTLENSEHITFSINFSASSTFELKKGELVSLQPFGKFSDTEIGRIIGTDYEYVFLIKNNSIIIEGQGKLSSLNQSFNSSIKLNYNQDYLWTNFMDVDERFAQEFEKTVLQQAKETNQTIYEINLENPYGGQGGLNISIDDNDIVNLSINASFSTPLELKQGLVIPLETKRRIKDRILGEVSGNGYTYTFSISENSLYIKGSGLVSGLNIFFTSPPPPNPPMTNEVTVEGLCFIYHYDKKGRLIEKKNPGKGWEYTVYDAQDRPLLTQDARMRLNDEWLFTKYDVYGRSLYTGLHNFIPLGSEDNASRIELQNLVDNQINPSWNETPQVSSIIGDITIDYSNSSYPSSDIQVLTVNYYDNYNFDDSGLSLTNGTDILGQFVSFNVNTLPTGNKVRILNTNQWITTVRHYDKKGHQIYVAKENQFINSTDITQTLFDFKGRVVKTEKSHTKGSSPSINTIDEFTFDHIGRTRTHVQTVNDLNPELITNNIYDELGQISSKKIGGSVFETVSESPGLQKIDYKFNIRGWLTQINDPSNLDDDLNNDLFGLKLSYDQPTLVGSTPIYNGNISEMFWSSLNDEFVRSYQYKYDALNRITEANYSGSEFYFPDNVSQPANQSENFSLKEISYDKNGNILHLERYGIHYSYAGTGGNTTTDIVDGLDYFYAENSNKLVNVTDFADNGFNFGAPDIDNGEFLEKYQGGDKYEYDVNGNLSKDYNKNISSITYNHLNLPETIIFTPGTMGSDATINFIYDASGNKLSKTVDYGNGNITATIYIENYIYEEANSNEELKFFMHNEGFAEPSGSTFNYTYQYKDHLNNIRLSFQDINHDGLVDETDIVKENHYYPFGSRHRGYNNIVNPSSNSIALQYMFGGKQYNEELNLNWYDITARNYDPSLGRWMNLDPFANKMPAISPYAFGFNNPIFLKDEDGRLPIIPLLLKAGASAAADYFMQTAMNYYFNPDTSGDWDASSEASNGWQTFRSGLEGLIPWKTPGGRLGRAAATAIGDVTVNYFNDMDGYTTEQAMQDFAIGFIGDLAGGGLGELISKYGTKHVANGLKRLNFNTKDIKKLTGFDISKKWIEGITPSFGGKIKARSGKTTTLLGSFALDMKKIIGDSGVITGKNKGGFNVLNIDNWTIDKNMKWLQDSIDRGDIIRFVSDPSEARAGSVFAQEIDYLISNGYEIIGNQAIKI
ncbi:MAG: hypothetical protein Tsb0033_15980 [Winogradskyella sp.]